MKDTIKNAVREESKQDLEQILSEKVQSLNNEGYSVSFGRVGSRTTYALIVAEPEEEYVGWSYVKNIEYYKPIVGQLKALQQAVARMKSIKSKSEDKEII